MDRSFVLCAYHGVLRAVTGLYPKVPVTEKQTTQFRDAYSITPEENRLVVFRVMLEWLRFCDTRPNRPEGTPRVTKEEALRGVDWLCKYAPFSQAERHAIVLHSLLSNFTNEQEFLPASLVRECVDSEIKTLVEGRFNYYYVLLDSGVTELEVGSLGRRMQIALIERDISRLYRGDIEYVSSEYRTLFQYAVILQETT